MKKLATILCIAIWFSNGMLAQTLIDTFAFDPTTQFNSFWGICDIDGMLQVGADGNGDIYQVDQNGAITATIDVEESINFNHGMVWDGQNYWTCEDYTSGGASLFQLDANGNILQSFVLPSVNGGNSSGVGGLTLDNGQLWYSVYYPDFDVYPFSYAYKIDLTTQQLTDTIPLYGKQVYGLAAKGDTIFYVTDDLDDDEERIYVFSKILGDTLFSFPLLDPDGDSSPRGLHWHGDYLWLVAKRPGGSAFAYSMLYQYEIGSPINPMPQMDIVEENIDMGMVYLTENSTSSFYIYNTGDGNLEIASMQTDNNVFSATEPILPTTVLPGDSINVGLTFEPTEVLVYDNELTISSNSTIDPIQVIGLSGEGVEMTATINQDPLPFRLFPNPADKYLWLEWGKNPQQELEILVYHISGKEEKRFILKSNDSELSKLDLSGLSPGIYVLKIKGYEETFSLLIQR